MTTRPPAAIGTTIATVIPLGLMVWASTDTHGLLRWLLISWVVFVLVLHLLTAAGWNPAEASRREATRAHTSSPRVHDHPPHRPPCSERLVDGFILRGACLNDDGSSR